jgi:hypothetical protein
MKLQSISKSDFHQINGCRQVIVDEHPRKFAVLDLGERLGVYGLGWNSELIDPEIVCSADGHTVWVGVDQYLAAIEVATGRIRVALKLHTNLLQILALERLTAIRTETEIFLFNPDFSIFLNKGFPDITQEMSVEGDKLVIHFLDEYSLTLDLQTGKMKNGSGSQSAVKIA